PGAKLDIVTGNAQGIELGQPFSRKLSVRAMPEAPDASIAPGVPKGLDGAELWFMSREVRDDHTPAAALVGGTLHTLIDGKGDLWRVLAAPIPANDGIAEVTAIANDVAGFHRIVVAYPGAFTDPAAAPGRVEIVLCNGQPRSQPCSDPETTPGTL